MHKMMLSLALVVSLGSSATQASAQDPVYFTTQFDAQTAAYLNSVLGRQDFVAGQDYIGDFVVVSRARGGGVNVEFNVYTYGIFLHAPRIFGTGKVNSSGTRLDVSKSMLIDFDILYRIRAKYSLPLFDLRDTP